MKIIIILISLLCSISLNSQSLKCYSPRSVDLETEALAPIDKISVDELNESGWKHRGVFVEYPDKLKEAMGAKVAKIASTLTSQENKLLKTVRILVYLNQDFKLMTYTVYIDKKQLIAFEAIEERVRNFMNQMDDMSFIKPYYDLPYDFTGTLYTLRFRSYL